MFAHAHFQTALQLVKSFKGDMPFVHFSRAYFSSNKKHGSRDRKQIAHLCYAYFRLGHALIEWPADRRMLAGLFLCSTEPNPLLEVLQPAWNEKAGLPLPEKLMVLGAGRNDLFIFPWTDLLSEGIDPSSFSFSHLRQPALFARIRPGYHEQVMRKLNDKWLEYTLPGTNAICLPNGFNAEEHFVINKEIVIQDLSSQKTGELMKLVPLELVRKKSFRVWDCCAASGGKTILAYDTFPSCILTVTDIRTSILNNLASRFQQAGIKTYHRLAADLAVNEVTIPMQDLIIADLPCTGSGTWSRNPEMLGYFDPVTIETFSTLQKKIASNVLGKLMPGGYFLYITCSVFKAENEENVQWLMNQFSLEMVRQDLINGLETQADSMFAALLKKN